MNHLALTLGVEEPDVITISIRPGVVNTAMQQDIREKHSASMQEKDVARFHQLYEEGSLLKPEQPGHVIAKLALDGPKELSGKFLRQVPNIRIGFPLLIASSAGMTKSCRAFKIRNLTLSSPRESASFLRRDSIRNEKRLAGASEER